MLTSREDISVPVCVTGMVTRIEIDFCMDGARYRVTSTIGDHRVKAGSAEVEAALERVAGSRTPIGVCGYIRQSAECFYLDAYWAGAPDRLSSLADDMRAGAD